MSGKRNVSVCRGHELANALYEYLKLETWIYSINSLYVWVGFCEKNATKAAIGKYSLTVILGL